MADCRVVRTEPTDLSSDNIDSAVLLDQSSSQGSIDDGIEKESNSPLDVAEECISSFLHQSIFNTMDDNVPEHPMMLSTSNNSSHTTIDVELQSKTATAEETINLLLEANNIVPETSMSDDRLSITADDDTADQCDAKNIEQKHFDVESEISILFVSELDGNRQNKFLHIETAPDRLSITNDDERGEQSGVNILEAKSFNNVLEVPCVPDSKSENRTHNSDETEANCEDNNEAKEACVDSFTTDKKKKKKDHKKQSKKKKKKHKKEKKQKKKKEKEMKFSEVGAQQHDKPQDVTSMLSKPDYSSSDDSEDQPINKAPSSLSSVVVQPSKQSHGISSNTSTAMICGDTSTATSLGTSKLDSISKLICASEMKDEDTKSEQKSSRSNSCEEKTSEDSSRRKSSSSSTKKEEKRRRSLSKIDLHEESKSKDETQKHSSSSGKSEKQERSKNLSKMDSHEQSKRERENETRRKHSTSMEKEGREDRKKSLIRSDSHEESKKGKEDKARRRRSTSIDKEGKDYRRKSVSRNDSHEESRRERENETRIDKNEKEDRRKSVSRSDSHEGKKRKDEPRRKCTSSTDKESSRSVKQNERSHRSRSKSRSLSYSKTTSKKNISSSKKQRSQSDASSPDSSSRRSRSKTPKRRSRSKTPKRRSRSKTPKKRSRSRTPKRSERKKHRKHRSRSKSPTKKDRHKSRSRTPKREISSPKKRQPGRSKSRSPRKDCKRLQRSRSRSPTKRNIPQSFMKLMSYPSSSSHSRTPSPVKEQISSHESSDKRSPSRKSRTKYKYSRSPSRSNSPKVRSTRQRSSDTSPKRKTQKLSIEKDGVIAKSSSATNQKPVRMSSHSISSERSVPSSTGKGVDSQTTKVISHSDEECSLASPRYSLQMWITGTPSTNQPSLQKSTIETLSTNQQSSEKKSKEQDESIMKKPSHSPNNPSPRKRKRESTDMKLTNVLDDLNSAERQSYDEHTVNDVGVDQTLSVNKSETPSVNNLFQAFEKDIPALETSLESVEPQQHRNSTLEKTGNSQPDKIMHDNLCKNTSLNNESAVVMTAKDTHDNTATKQSSIHTPQQRMDQTEDKGSVTKDVAGLVTKDKPSMLAKEIASEDIKSEKAQQNEHSVQPARTSQSVVTNFDHLPPPPAPPFPMPFPNLFSPVRQFNRPGVPPGAGFAPRLPVAPPLMGSSQFPRGADTSFSSHAQSNVGYLPQHQAEVGNNYVNMTGIPEGLAPTNELEAVNQQPNRTLLGLPTSASVIPFLGDTEGPKPTNGNDEPASTDVMESAGSPVDMELSASSPEVDIIEKMNQEFWQNEQNALDEAYEPELLPDEPVLPVDAVVDNGSSDSKKSKKKKKDKKHEAKDEPKTKVQVLLDKLHRQARVEEEVKIVLKEYYKHREIDKNEYKSILRKAVPQVADSNHSIDPERIRSLVKKYVAKTKGARLLKH